MDRYLGHYIRRLGLTPEEFYGLGRQNPGTSE